MVWLVDYAYDVPVGFVEGKGMVGGYTLRTINSTRLCLSNINLTCLKFKGADVSKLSGLPLLKRCVHRHAYRSLSGFMAPVAAVDWCSGVVGCVANGCSSSSSVRAWKMQHACIVQAQQQGCSQRGCMLAACAGRLLPSSIYDIVVPCRRA
jgi:hypothetical protein